MMIVVATLEAQFTNLRLWAHKALIFRLVNHRLLAALALEAAIVDRCGCLSNLSYSLVPGSLLTFLHPFEPQ